MRFDNFLERFRPAGAPGAAAAVGVPADRPLELAAELEPVFGELSGVVAHARRIREQASFDADQIRCEAKEKAHVLVESAGNELEDVRAAAMASAGERAQQVSQAALAAAELDAAAVRSRAADRLPAYVDRALDLARNVLKGAHS
ncbi:hypothetical protein [Rhodococcus sp. IEGM 1379]|uniref:hypothetical protein n=1 Tax=Rhodococcus sp. IEGM 1379 TaxID=3047086 RepID=UPI0024B7C054|nr:hypothetical protein [Rhodococcus sp. IEGM 1379]MDI9914454.1 hypothetical protein [Rhodococcus sp. IEGM 1379]